jgi:transcriptional regulator with XRE-family HTH domain
VAEDAGAAVPEPGHASLPFQDFFNRMLRERGWSLRYIGARIGVAGPNVWSYVHGGNTPSEAVQERIARLAGVAVQDVARLVWEQKRLRRAQLARRRATTAGRSSREAPAGQSTGPWADVEALIGSIEGPTDWAAEHDHYLYGTPRRRRPRRR